MSHLDRILGIIDAYAELAAGWIPSEEVDYDQFKEELRKALMYVSESRNNSPSL